MVYKILVLAYKTVVREDLRTGNLGKHSNILHTNKKNEYATEKQNK